MTESTAGSLQPDFFNRIYADADDPWSFATSPYEQAKYAATLEALPRLHYQAAFEIGCSVGVLTNQLAQRCDALLSVDVSERALTQARARCKHQPWVQFQQMQVPSTFPTGSFDLIAVSEVGYYWSLPDLDHALELICQHLEGGGSLLLVHWTPFVAEYPITGDQVHERVLELARSGALPLLHLTGNRTPTYRLDVFERSSFSDSS